MAGGKPSPTTETTARYVRFPDAVWEAMVQLASEHDRTTSAEITFACRQYMVLYGKGDGRTAAAPDEMPKMGRPSANDRNVRRPPDEPGPT